MNKFNRGDKVIIKSTIGSTNEVCNVIEVQVCKTATVGSLFYIYHLSNGNTYSDRHLELWNPKKDLNGDYRMKIDMNKKYRTRDGFDVEIIAIRPDLKDGVIGVIDGEDFVREWSTEGLYSHDREPCDFDLIEFTPYADLKVDDKVLVSNDKRVWKKGHYAGIEKSGDGYFKPMIFNAGRTSFTSKSNPSFLWDYCIKFEDRTTDMEIVYD